MRGKKNMAIVDQVPESIDDDYDLLERDNELFSVLENPENKKVDDKP